MTTQGIESWVAGSRHTERWPIVESEAGSIFSEAKLGLEGIDVPPELDDLPLGLWETDAHDD